MKRLLITLGLFFFSTPLVAFAGSQSYTSPGTYTFTVPSYGTMTVTVNGAGGVVVERRAMPAMVPFGAAPVEHLFSMRAQT